MEACFTILGSRARNGLLPLELVRRLHPRVSRRQGVHRLMNAVLVWCRGAGVSDVIAF